MCTGGIDICHVEELLARPYSPIKDKSWCTLQQQPNEMSGLWYIKNPKTASSTAAAVTLQIATNVAQHEFGFGQNTNASYASSPTCTNLVHYHTDYSRRKEQNLLGTTLQEPAERSVAPSQMIQSFCTSPETFKLDMWLSFTIMEIMIPATVLSKWQLPHKLRK
jgi:hypothetical protein